MERGQVYYIKFLSTLSLRRATWHFCVFTGKLTYFYPRSPCGERLFCTSIKHVRWIFLSTLSLRRATCAIPGVRRTVPISIHALLAESDLASLRPRSTATRFLSTLSLRRATIFNTLQIIVDGYFYPRSPCGERLAIAVGFLDDLTISIHALLAESDFLLLVIRWLIHRFLSTLSLRRATLLCRILFRR